MVVGRKFEEILRVWWSRDAVFCVVATGKRFLEWESILSLRTCVGECGNRLQSLDTLGGPLINE
jgi:hypothetical protein